MIIIPDNPKATYQFIGDKRFLKGSYTFGKYYHVRLDDSLLDSQIYLCDDKGQMNWEFACNFVPVYQRKAYRIIYGCRDFEEDKYIKYPVDVVIYGDDDINDIAEQIKENLRQSDIIIYSIFEREGLKYE